MNSSDWIALAALLVAVAGTGSATFYARRSAKTAEDAAASARKSADEAAALTAIEADRRREEKDRWHHELAPSLPNEIVATLEKGPYNQYSVIGALTLAGTKAYRVDAEALFVRGGGTPVSLPLVLEPGAHTFHIEHWAPDQEFPAVGAIAFKFWAPVEQDETELWDCPCGQPTAETAGRGGHWTRTIRVAFKDDRPRLRSIPD